MKSKINILELLLEASYLLYVNSPDSCPSWKEDVGDCKKSKCMFCRIQRCINALDELT